MPQEQPGAQPCPSRRSLLVLGVVGAASMSLAACGIRLEDDAPRVPLVPTRAPVPGERFLLDLWRHSTDLAERAGSLAGAASSLPARLAALHRTQAGVLEGELVALGVPRSVLDAAGTTPTTSAAGTTSPTSRPTGPATPTPADSGPAGLAAAESLDTGPAAVTALAAVTSTALPLAGALLAQRSAAAVLLGHPAEVPEPTWSQTSLAASYLETTRAAVYAFEVIAAQSGTGAQRTLAGTTLAALQARSQIQEGLAGADGGAPALAYPLPYPVTTPAKARTLATTVLTGLRAAVARDLGSTAGDTGPLASVVQWLADTEVLASRWGIPLVPFPGLK